MMVARQEGASAAEALRPSRGLHSSPVALPRCHVSRLQGRWIKSPPPLNLDSPKRRLLCCAAQILGGYWRHSGHAKG